MARTKASLAGLNVGEVSRTALSRIDIPRIQGAAAFQENIIALTEGAMRFRPGTVYTGSRTRNDLKARIVPFAISSIETAMLEFTDFSMRVFVGNTLVTRVAVATSFTNPTFAGTITPWTTVLDAGCGVTTSPSGVFLTSTRLGQCRLLRTVTISSVGVEHAFRIKLFYHPVRLRIGTTTSSDDIVGQTLLLPGEHSIAFTPAVGTIYVTVDAVDVGNTFLAEFSLEPAGAVTLGTPWAEAELSSIRSDQSVDVLFAASGLSPPKRIERRSMRSWSITDYVTEDGPFTSERPEKVLMNASATTGTPTITSNVPLFNSSFVGQLLEIYHGRQSRSDYLYREGHSILPVKIIGFGTQRAFTITITGLTGTGTTVTVTRSTEEFGRYNNYAGTSYTADVAGASINDGLDNREIFYRVEILKGNYSTGAPLVTINTVSGSQRGVAKILLYNSPTSVTVEVIETLGDTSETDDWRLGDWSDLRGWPATPALHDGRLFWKRKDNYYGSVSDDFSSFDQTETGDSAPILRRSGTGPVEGSLWLLSLQRLIDGGASIIRSIRSSSFDAPLTPTSFLARDIDSRGSAPLSPVKLDSTGIYMSRDYKRALEIAYNVDINDYGINNLTRLSQDIFKGVTVTAMGAQRHPVTRIWFVCSDGTARILSYDKDEQVFAWARWRTDGILEDICTRPSNLGSIMYLVVKRTIGGTDYRFHERVALDADAAGDLLSIMSDCSVVYTGAPTSVITGLGHLEGENVVVWADGRVIADGDAPLTVTGGRVTLPTASDGLAVRSTVVVGLDYRGKWRGAKLAFGGQMGTAISQRKQTNAISMLLSDTAIGGIRVGPNFTQMSRLETSVRGKTINPGMIIDEYDIDPITLPAWADPDARVHITTKAPYPATFTGTMVDVITHES